MLPVRPARDVALYTLAILVVCGGGGGGCSADHDDDCPAVLYYSSMELRFTPMDSTHDRHVAVSEDLTGDGLPDRVIGIDLADGVSYQMSVDIELFCYGSQTDVIRASGSAYQFLYRGTGVTGPGSASADPVVAHAYADSDDEGLPIGLTSVLDTRRAGTGVLEVYLLSLPVIDQGPQKFAGLAEYLRDNQVEDWPGDIQGRFQFTIAVD